MPYPVQSFATFNDLLVYINNNWVTNDNGDIDAIVGNNVVNGLLTFITQSPLNYQKAAVSASTGAVVVGRPATIFTATPSALSWGDNIYNQLVFINTTGNAIPLLSGFYYRDINLAAAYSIPRKTVLVLYKTNNNEWVMGTPSAGGNYYTYVPAELEFEIGVDPDMDPGDTQITITAEGVEEESLQIFLDGSFLYKDRNDRISYTVVFGVSDFTITFNQAVSNGQLYNISYGQNI